MTFIDRVAFNCGKQFLFCAGESKTVGFPVRAVFVIFVFAVHSAESKGAYRTT